MNHDRGGSGRRGPQKSSAGKKFNWRRFLIEVGVAIGVINVLAAFLIWYFILPRMRH